MQIEITGEIEALIREELALGHYRTPEECIAAIIRNWEAMTRERMPEMPKNIDVDALAAKQGIEAIRDPEELKADFWPDDESVDDFIAEIRTLRAEQSQRAR